VGYKLARVVQFAIVWPFQLGWPAVSFSISSQDGHRDTYARVLTYLCLVLVFSVLAISFVMRIAVSGIVGEGFHEAYRVVPLVALAYTFNGIQFCVAPGVHLSGRTRYLSAIALSAAVLNLALNFLLIPHWGMMGAGAATAASFLLVALLTGAVAQRFYPVDYEYRRLGKLFVAGLVIFTIGVQVPPEVTLFSVSWHLVIGIVALPVVLLASGFVEDDERRALRGIAQRFLPFGAR
jgi:O-antigen/teichoic acid export membrane protein